MKTKRAFKAIIAMALSFILSVGMFTTAFAASGNEINWTVGGETAACAYLSDLKVGTNTVAIEETGYYYFDLSELENGYYSAEIKNNVFDYFSFPEKSGGEYSGWGNGEYINGGEKTIFNIKDNTDVAVAGAYGTEEQVTIEIEYLGEAIESIDFGSRINDEHILHYDIMEWYYETDEITCAANFDATVTFTSGKTIETGNRNFLLTCENSVVSGKNTMTVNFVGYKTECEIDVAYISDYISGVEVEVPADAAAYVYYDGTICLSEFDFEEITVCFTDGTQQTYKFNDRVYVTLPNGREIMLDTYIFDDNADAHRVCISIGAGNSEIDVIELNTEEISFKKNLEHFRQNINAETESLNSRLKSFFGLIFSGKFDILAYEFNYFIDDFRWSIFRMVLEVQMFIEFIF